MVQHFSHMISVYRTNYGSQHVIFQLIEEWRKKSDSNFVVGAVLTDLLQHMASVRKL